MGLPTAPEWMEAWVLSGRGREHFRRQKVPVPRPGPEQLLARVDAVNICASDLKIIAQGMDHPLMGGWDVERYPVIPGHEGSLTLVEVGSRLRDRFRPGQRVVVQPALPISPILHRERYKVPERMRKTSIGYTLPGFFAEYVLLTEEAVRSEAILPVPERLPHFAAACAEPLSCVLASHQQHVHLLQPTSASPRQVHHGLRPGGVVLLFGAGPMGLMHLDVARWSRPRAIVVVEPLAERQERVRRGWGPLLGREGIGLEVVEPGGIGEALRRWQAEEGAADVIVAVGKVEVQAEALRWVAPGGILNLFGGTANAEERWPLDPRRIHYDQVRIVGSSGGSIWDLEEALRWLAEGRLHPEGYIGAVGGLDAVGAMLEAVAHQRIGGKGVIYPQCRAPLQRVSAWGREEEERWLRENRNSTLTSP